MLFTDHSTSGGIADIPSAQFMFSILPSHKPRCKLFGRMLEGEGPVVVVVYMVQQINCVRNKAGEITEVRLRTVGENRCFCFLFGRGNIHHSD